MTTITGNTYPVRRELQALGAIWLKTQRAWSVPDKHAEEAKRLVACAATHYKENNPLKAAARVVAPCWDCKAPDGRFRNYGAGTPVYCDACHAKYEAIRARGRDHSSHEDRCCGDAAYEDRCAEQCGPGL